MQRIHVYSSAPVSPQLAGAFLGLAAAGLLVELRPLCELPAGPGPARRRSEVCQELEQVSIQLATIGEQLDWHERGQRRLGAGEEQGLLALRDSLTARRRGLIGNLKGLAEGGPANG